MAYPNPVPPLSGRGAKDFREKLDNFKLSSAQKKFYKDGKKYAVRRK